MTSLSFRNTSSPLYFYIYYIADLHLFLI